MCRLILSKDVSISPEKKRERKKEHLKGLWAGWWNLGLRFDGTIMEIHIYV